MSLTIFCVLFLSISGSLLVLASVDLAAGGTKIRLATEAATPPLSYVGKDGQLTGFDVDIGNALCAVMAAECVWVVEDWDSIIPGVNQYRYDAIVSSLPMDDATREKVVFTNRYHVQPATFIGAETMAVPEINKETLTDKMIGVQAGSVHEAFLRDNFGDIAAIKPYELVAQATLDMVGQRLDLVFGDRIELENNFLNTEEGRGFKPLGPSYTDAKWFGDGAGIALRKTDKALMARFNMALDTIRTNGTYKKINDRYFDFDVFGN